MRKIPEDDIVFPSVLAPDELKRRPLTEKKVVYGGCGGASGFAMTPIDVIRRK